MLLASGCCDCVTDPGVLFSRSSVYLFSCSAFSKCWFRCIAGQIYGVAVLVFGAMPFWLRNRFLGYRFCSMVYLLSSLLCSRRVGPNVLSTNVFALVLSRRLVSRSRGCATGMRYLSILYFSIVVVLLCEFWGYFPMGRFLEGSRFCRCYFLAFVGFFFRWCVLFLAFRLVQVWSPRSVYPHLEVARLSSFLDFCLAFVVVLFPRHLWSGFVGQLLVFHVFIPTVRLIQYCQAFAGMCMLARRMCFLNS